MKKNKNFDAVKMMREIRDKLSREFNKMTFDEKRKFIQEELNLNLKSKKQIKTIQE